MIQELLKKCEAIEAGADSSVAHGVALVSRQVLQACEEAGTPLPDVAVKAMAEMLGVAA